MLGADTQGGFNLFACYGRGYATVPYVSSRGTTYLAMSLRRKGLG